MIQQKPLVSVIIPMFNCEKFINETIESVLKQTFADFELIAVNDGSSDETGNMVNRIAEKDKRLIYIQQENKGVSAARNKAIELSRGKFLAFLDHDDIWLPNKLENQIPLFDKDSKTGIVFSNAVYFSEEGKSALLYRKNPPVGRIFGELLMHPFLCISTVIIRKDTLLELKELFDNRLHLGEELDIFLRLSYKWNAAYVDKTLVKYRLHSNSYTSQNKENIPKEKEIILEKLIKVYPQVESEFKHEIFYLKSRIQYDYALLDWKRGNGKVVRSRLRPYLGKNIKLLLPYLFSYLPYRFYNSFLALDKRNMS